MISKEEIIEKVGILLKELSEKFEYISDPEKDIHPLEFQLFEVNASYFAEHTSILRKIEEEEAKNKVAVEDVEEGEADVERELSGNTDTAQKETSTEDNSEEGKKTGEPIFFTPAIGDDFEEEEPDTQETVAEIPEEQDDVSEQKEEVSEEEKAPEEVVAEEAPVEEIKEDTPSSASDSSGEARRPESQSPNNQQNQPAESSNQASPRTEAAASQPREVVNEVVIEEKKVSVANDRPISLNERLSEQRKSLGGDAIRQQETPQRIRDIKSVISLNDKLLFIKDLFNGYSLAYSEAIELLNRYETFADADLFLQNNYAEKNNWAAKQATVEKLYAILRKRYG